MLALTIFLHLQSQNWLITIMVNYHTDYIAEMIVCSLQQGSAPLL